ncbi:SRPBCC family protein [Hyphomicrobium sp.]|uniref:SRPBCC family protein n=1 Tax=Hyphomicrobium sp. TaxID=82 RepID=UPI002E370D96|nr:SRPBCC family protein [Hyphomicrobium sp.]HEX2842581.1 SRPBCC family protein [Hyphomicrobium sp.]
MITTALYIALGLAALFLAVVAYASRRPDTFETARSTRIEAAPDQIFPLINDLRLLSTWSPFEKKDPNIKRAYSGPESGKGQKLDWDGNSEVGQGTLTIVSSSPSSEVNMELRMVRPMAANNGVQFTLVPEGKQTKVTWTMHGNVPLFAKVLHLFVDMDRMCGGEFEKGLASLKSLVEGASVPAVQG